MTYSPRKQAYSTLEASIVKVGTASPASVGSRFTLSGSQTNQFTIVDGRLRLAQGYSYYIEASPLVQNGARNGAVTFQWYDHTNSQLIGASGFMNFNPNLGASARIGRRVATALITSSEVSTGIDVELRITGLTGSSWSFTIDSGGISGFTFPGYPSARILALAD